MAHATYSDESSAVTKEMSVIVGDEDSDLMSKPNFNSTAVTFEDRLFVHREDWKSVNNSLRLSPILRDARSPLMIRRKASHSGNSSPLARREFERLLDDTSQFVPRAEQSSLRERRYESGYETSVDLDGRRLQLIEEDKENELDGAHEHPGTSTPVRICDCNQTAETTRSNRLMNPFESRLLESLCVSTFSPSLFSGSKTPPKINDEGSPSKFRWSIGEMAILNPVDIDESKADLVESPDPIFEARVQGAIDKFWSSQKFVVPSPDANLVSSASSSRTEHSPFQHPSYKRPLYRTANRNTVRREESPLVRPDIQRFNSPLRRTKDAQTLLTFPPDLDLVKLLGGRFQFNEEEGGAEEAAFEANLSLNTLRRKLFADYDTSFSSRGNDSDSLNATQNIPSPPLLKFDEDDDEPSEGEYLESDISAHEDMLGSPSVGRRRMASPNMSPITLSD